MGYTHHYTATTNEGLVADTLAIFKNSPVALAGPMGSGEPVANFDEIAFNGDNENDEDHETFRIESATRSMAFCKTQMKPYDVVVVAVLVAVVANNAGEVSSDGNYEDWAEGIALYEHSCGKLSKEKHKKLVQSLG